MTDIRRPRLPTPRGLERGPLVELTIDGRPTMAYLGESVAAAMLADGTDDLSTRTTSTGDRRGVFCGMGVCFDCLVIVDGVPGTRACMTWVRPWMVVSRQDGPGVPQGERAHDAAGG